MCCIVSRCFAAALALAGLVATRAAAEEADPPALIYSPWTRFCLSDTCFVGRDGRRDDDCGSVVAAVLIERNGDTKKTLRVILPTRVNPERGVRIAIDQGEEIERPFGTCFASGCMADYDAGTELVGQLKQGQRLFLKAIDKANSPIDLTVPLAGFANAYDGPSHEPKVYEESAVALQEKLTRQKHAEEERKDRCGAR